MFGFHRQNIVRQTQGLEDKNIDYMMHFNNSDTITNQPFLRVILDICLKQYETDLLHHVYNVNDKSW